MKWINIIVLTILVIFGFAFIYEYETVNSYFEDYGEVSRAGTALSSGWTPQFLPKSARNINERHNIDTNETWVSFRFDPADSATLNGCSSIKKQAVKFPREDQTVSIAWWKLGTTGQNNNGSHQFYQCDEVSFFVVNPIDHRAYYWVLTH